MMETNPFAPKTTDPALSDRENKYYNEIDPKGNIIKYKVESGVPVVVEDLGNIKDFAQRALQKIATMRPDELSDLHLSNMSHIELSLVQLLTQASQGNPKAITEVLDRILGRPISYTENKNLTLTLDDVLKDVPEVDTINGECETD